MTRLAASAIAELDPYKFMAVMGKRVSHPGGRASKQSLLARAGINARCRVLDVGCGVATTAIEIARTHGAHVTAADISPLVLERAEANVRAAGAAARVSVAHGDILDLDFADETFDVVIATRLAHVRKMAWLMPRMARTVPYLGYIVVAAEKPR